MTNTVGANVYIHEVELTSEGVALGRVITEYQVSTIYDIRNLKRIVRYVIDCRQRLVVNSTLPGAYTDAPGNAYGPYPMLLTNEIIPKRLTLDWAKIADVIEQNLDEIKQKLEAAGIDPSTMFEGFQWSKVIADIRDGIITEEDLRQILDVIELAYDGMAEILGDIWLDFDAGDCQIVNYEPRTLNTMVNSSLNGNTSASNTS